MRSLLGAEPLRLAELPKPAFRGGCGVVQLVCLTEDQLTDKKRGGFHFNISFQLMKVHPPRCAAAPSISIFNLG
jgi:hypothetical protein